MMTQSKMKYGQRNSKMLLDEAYFWTDTTPRSVSPQTENTSLEKNKEIRI